MIRVFFETATQTNSEFIQLSTDLMNNGWLPDQCVSSRPCVKSYSSWSVRQWVCLLVKWWVSCRIAGEVKQKRFSCFQKSWRTQNVRRQQGKRANAPNFSFVMFWRLLFNSYQLVWYRVCQSVKWSSHSSESESVGQRVIQSIIHWVMMVRLWISTQLIPKLISLTGSHLLLN